MVDDISTPPLQIAVISSDTGRHLVQTAPNLPNIMLTFVSPLAAIMVRFLDTFLTTLVALVTAGMSTNLIPVRDFADLVEKAALLALTGAALGLMKDLLVIFGRLKQRYPLLDA